jgi:three-Cys-motif partner protein
VTDKVQKFGGPWSLIKTKIITAYLQAYSTALKQQGFRLTYIDAFAGSGAFTFDQAISPFFDDTEAAIAHAGSAQNALSITPPFDELIFIEQKPANVEALQRLIAGHPKASVIAADANQALIKICDPKLWRPQKRRGVVFLDPFGLDVAWPTLEAIAKTEALDLWYLFSLFGLYRNAPLNIDDLGPDKRAAITRALGIENWVDQFYEKLHSNQASFFDEPPQPARRTLSVDGMELLVEQRLKTIFPYVAKPRRLLGSTKAPLFSLFFAISNPNLRAIGLAKNIAEHILKRR